jgi:poly(3-hydroxybutyrate) depolymerase
MKSALDRRALLVGAAAAGVSACATSPAPHRTRTVDAAFTHADGRTTPIRIVAPESPAGRLGYVVFSHGANSNGRLYDRMLEPMAASGFVVVAPTHVDAETNPDRKAFDAAATLATRLADLAWLGDNIAEVAARAEIPAAAIDGDVRAIAGHSYGALLSLYLTGARFRPLGAVSATSIRDPRYRAALAFSPPGPLPNFLAAEQFDTIAAPSLVTTGHRDVLPMMAADWRVRLAAFERAAATPAYAAIFPDVDHYFGGLICRFEAPGPPQPESLGGTMTVARLFLAAHVRKDARAARRLAAAAKNPSTLAPGLELRMRV